MNSYLVGEWTIASNGVHRFNYSSEWLSQSGARPISFSLPLISSSKSHKGQVVENFFDNLLPDTRAIRERLQTRFKADSRSAYDLLSLVGRDCLGAIQIVPADGDFDTHTVGMISGDIVKEAEIAKILRETPLQRSSLRSLKDFRISLAGAQEKTTFCRSNENWRIPSGTTPSTHIFKLPIGDIGIADLSDSLENEYLCSKIINRFGIPIAETRIERFEEQKTLIVTRFDRKWDLSGKGLLRLPYEDFCQATGTSSAFKYQSDGGPSIKNIMDILAYSVNAKQDRELFLKSLMLNWLLAAPDAHAKNFSISIGVRGAISLAPLYDVASAYPYLDRKGSSFTSHNLKMAMKCEYYRWNKILPRHWVRTASSCGMSEETTLNILSELIDKTDDAVEMVYRDIPKGFPESVSGPILEGLQEKSEFARSMMF